MAHVFPHGPIGLACLAALTACGPVGGDVYLGERRPTPDADAPRSTGVNPRLEPTASDSQTGTTSPSTPTGPETPKPGPTRLSANLVWTDGHVPSWIVPGQAEKLTFTIENHGQGSSPPVSVRFWLHGDRSFEWISGMIPSLEPGASVTLHWSAPLRGEFPTGSYVLEGTVDPDQRVPESDETDNHWFGARVNVGPVSVEPFELDFPVVAPGCEAFQEVHVTNRGRERATVTQFAFRDGSGDFAVKGASFPLSLDPSESRTIQVRYAPRAVATQVTELRWRTEHDRGFFEIPVFASSERFPLRVDPRIQKDAVLDVLLLVDDAPSMEPELSELLPYLQPMIRRLETPGADVQIAVGTPDPQAPLAGDPVSHRDPDAVHRIRRLLQVAPVAKEPRFFEAMIEATVPSLQGGWIRPDAALSVVFVTHRDDDSSESPESYASALLRSRSDFGLHRTVANAIVLDGSDRCDGMAATHLLALVAALDGHTSAICDADDFDALWSLPHPRFGVPRRFDLSVPLMPQTLAVRVNGVGIDPTDWSRHGPHREVWNEEPQGVRFAPRRQPAPGAVVELEYVPACRPQ